jgi:FKBP-type peptidyl-prolyl cis-trans isomerase 2
MAPAKKGDSVKVEYTGKMEDGTVFDSSREREPLCFTIGARQVIEGFEEAVIGMDVGESKTCGISPEKGYGPRYDDHVLKIDRSQIPPELNPKVGDQLQSRSEEGRPVRAIVIEVDEDTLTLDANHPLAGKNLIFDIEVLEIVASE